MVRVSVVVLPAPGEDIRLKERRPFCEAPREVDLPPSRCLRRHFFNLYDMD